MSPLSLALGAVEVFLLLRWLVELFDFLGEGKDAVFDGIYGCMEIDEAVFFVDRSSHTLPRLGTGLPRKAGERTGEAFQQTDLHC